jgi:hypothetical protein
LVRSELVYSSDAWTSVTITDSNKLEHIQRTSAALCHNRFFQDVWCQYGTILEKLNLQKPHISCRHSDALFLINIYNGAKCCPCPLEAVDTHVPARDVGNFSRFSCSFSHCLSIRSVSAKNDVCKCTDIFNNSCLSLKSCLVHFSSFIGVSFVLLFVFNCLVLLLLLFVFLLTL